MNLLFFCKKAWIGKNDFLNLFVNDLGFLPILLHYGTWQFLLKLQK